MNRNKNVQTGGTPIFKIEPLQVQQAMNARLDKVKVSVIPSGFTECSFLIHASADGNSSTTDEITAQAVPQGGGTVWLSLKRSLKSDRTDPDRSDGSIMIYARSSVPVNADFFCEAWGSFLDVDPQ